MQLKDYIGEATAYDKKLMLERKDPTSWLKSVSAFANTQGGRLLFGAANDGALVGLADAQGDSEFISEAIKAQMDPVPEIDLSLHEEDGKQFVVVEIKDGSETPYYTFVKGHRDAFIRIGNESVKANAIQLKRLVLKSTGQTWDVLDSPFLRTNYAFDALRAAYFKKTEMPFEESDFKSFGLVGSDGFLTNAGALFADDSPIRHSRLFCTRWRGLTKADGVMEAVDDHEYSGSLLSLLSAAKLFVMGFTLVLPNLNYGQTIEGLVGEEPMDGSGKADVMGESLVRAVGDVDWDVDKNVVRILDVVKGDPHVTQQEIATRLNLSLRGVEDMIKRAREKGLIRRVGGKRFGHWEVVK